MNARMKINYKKYISLFVIGYLSIIFFVFYLIQPFVFSTNDDKLMQDILSGSISGTPDSHAIFLNYTFSLLISYGYKMIPYINWYGVILVALIFVASAWILEVLVRSFDSVKEVIVCILLFTGLFIYFFYSEIVGLQHMSTAGYLLSAALFLFAHDTQPIDFEKHRFLSRYGRIIFLVLFAYFLRADAVIMFIPFYVIAFAYKIYTNKEQLRDYVKLVCVLGLSIFLFGTLHFLAYSNVEWKSYKEFNQYRSKIYDTYGLPDYDISIITGSKTLADLFEKAEAICGNPKKVSNWLMVETMRLLKEHEMDAEDITFSPENLAKLIQLTDENAINSSVAKEVFEKIFEENVDPEKYVLDNGLKTVNDEGALRGTIEQIVADNPQSVEDYHAGKTKAIGFLVGQTMKAMKGKADPGMVNKILKELL